MAKHAVNQVGLYGVTSRFPRDVADKHAMIINKAAEPDR